MNAAPLKFKYYILYKPRDCLSARGDHGKRPQNALDVKRDDIYDVASRAGFPTEGIGHVGRLDYETSGIMLMTNDALLNRAVRDKSFSGPPVSDGVPRPIVPPLVKSYVATVAGAHEAGSAPIERLKKPLRYEGRNAGNKTACYDTAPAEIVVRGSWSLRNCAADDACDPGKEGTDLVRAAGPGGRPPLTWNWATGGAHCVRPRREHEYRLPADGILTEIEVRIGEGRNRQVRRLMHRSRLRLRHLHREAIGPLRLGSGGSGPKGGMRPGDCRWLSFDEVHNLYRLCMPGVSVPVAPTSTEKAPG